MSRKGRQCELRYATAGGDPNSAVTRTINLPAGSGHLGRCATFLPTITAAISITSPGDHTALDCPASTTSRSQQRRWWGDNLNTVEYQGFRLSLCIKSTQTGACSSQKTIKHGSGRILGRISDPVPRYGLAPHQIDAYPAFNKGSLRKQSLDTGARFTDLGKVWRPEAVIPVLFLSRHIEHRTTTPTTLRASPVMYACRGGRGYFKTSKPTTCYARLPTGMTRCSTPPEPRVRFSTSEDNRYALVGGVWEDFIIPYT